MSEFLDAIRKSTEEHCEQLKALQKKSDAEIERLLGLFKPSKTEQNHALQMIEHMIDSVELEYLAEKEDVSHD